MKNFLIGVALCATMTAQAEFYSGKRLYDQLTHEDVSTRSIGIGYIVGAADATMNVVWCPVGGNFTITDTIGVVLYAMKENQNLLEKKSGDQFVTFALSTIFPCKKGSNA